MCSSFVSIRRLLALGATTGCEGRGPAKEPDGSGLPPLRIQEGCPRGKTVIGSDYIDLETRALKYSMGRPDAIEGGMAYFEKRPPNWASSVSGDYPDWMEE